MLTTLFIFCLLACAGLFSYAGIKESGDALGAGLALLVICVPGIIAARAECS